MIAGMTFYQICWYFLLYAFAGWVVEVAFHAVTMGKVVNRGFLNGPVCPIYGFGMIGVLMLSTLAAGWMAMTELSKPLLFLLGALLCSLVELLAGWGLDKFFHARWWDYSDMPLNFHGYICPAFTLLWGLGVVIAVDLIHPLIARYSAAAIPEKYGWPLLALLYALLLADTVVTLIAVIGLNKRLEEIDALTQALRRPSDKMAATVTEGTLRVANRVQEGKIQAALGRAELRDEAAIRRKELEKERAELIGCSDWRVRRLLNAYPKLEHHEYSGILQELRRQKQEEHGW